MSHVIAYHRKCPMSHPAPSNADPIRLTATRSHREARNSLTSGALELNLMTFGSESVSQTNEESKTLGQRPCQNLSLTTACSRQGKPETLGVGENP